MKPYCAYICLLIPHPTQMLMFFYDFVFTVIAIVDRLQENIQWWYMSCDKCHKLVTIIIARVVVYIQKRSHHGKHIILLKYEKNVILYLLSTTRNHVLGTVFDSKLVTIHLLQVALYLMRRLQDCLIHLHLICWTHRMGNRKKRQRLFNNYVEKDSYLDSSSMIIISHLAHKTMP